MCGWILRIKSCQVVKKQKHVLLFFGDEFAFQRYNSHIACPLNRNRSSQLDARKVVPKKMSFVLYTFSLWAFQPISYRVVLILFFLFHVSFTAHFLNWTIFKCLFIFFCFIIICMANRILSWTWHWIAITCEFAYSTKLGSAYNRISCINFPFFLSIFVFITVCVCVFIFNPSFCCCCLVLSSFYTLDAVNIREFVWWRRRKKINNKFIDWNFDSPDQ